MKAIELVGSYSISLKELQDILSYLYTGQTESWVREALQRLLIDSAPPPPPPPPPTQLAILCMEGCPHWRGVLIGEMSSLEGCPHWRGVLTGGASSLEGRRPHWRGVLTGGASSLEGRPHWKGVPIWRGRTQNLNKPANKSSMGTSLLF